MKVCSKCGIEKAEEEYYSNGNGHKRPDCRICKRNYDEQYYRSHIEQTRRYNRNYREKNLQKTKETRRAYYDQNKDVILQKAKNYRIQNFEKLRQFERKRKYNLSPEEFQNWVVRQRGLCVICGNVMKKIHVDHHHRTGNIRGLLCW